MTTATKPTVNHSPGPWKFDGGIGKNGERYVWTDRDEKGKGYLGTIETPICTVQGKTRHDESHLGQEEMLCLETIVAADARLIAAAPDLLAACESMLRTCGSSADWNGETHESLKLIEAAIRKATGQK